MNILQVFAFSLTAFIAASSYAIPGVFYGKIGKDEFRMVVTMKSKKNLRGNYYTFKNPKDIFIFGRVYDENTLLLEERINNKFTGIFEFKIDSENDESITISEGSWYSPDRKIKKRVRITQLNQDKEETDQSLYNKLRPGTALEDSEMKKGKSVLRLERLRSGSQQAKYILKDFKKPESIGKINEFLKEWSSIDCTDTEDPDTTWDGGINVELDAKFWRDDLLYLSRTVSGYCPSSSHPLAGELETVVYDLNKMKTVPFPDLFKDWPKDKSVIIKALFAKPIEDFEKLQANSKVTNNDLDNVGCEGSQSLQEFIQAADYSMDYEINFFEKKIKVTRKFQNVSNLCKNVESEIPLEKLARQLKPEYQK